MLVHTGHHVANGKTFPLTFFPVPLYPSHLFVLSCLCCRCFSLGGQMHPVAHEEGGGSQSLSLRHERERPLLATSAARYGGGQGAAMIKKRKEKEFKIRRGCRLSDGGGWVGVEPQKVWCMIWSSSWFCTALLARRFTFSASGCALAGKSPPSLHYFLLFLSLSRTVSAHAPQSFGVGPGFFFCASWRACSCLYVCVSV